MSFQDLITKHIAANDDKALIALT
jgi:hypothetical protein